MVGAVVPHDVGGQFGGLPFDVFALGVGVVGSRLELDLAKCTGDVVGGAVAHVALDPAGTAIGSDCGVAIFVGIDRAASNRHSGRGGQAVDQLLC